MMTAYVGHLILMSLHMTVLHTLPAPANLTIVSHNFRHILQWNPGIGTPPRTVFNFKLCCRKGKSTERLNITNTSVDVSKTLKNIYSYYNFSVWASLDNTTSLEVQKSFTPYEETIIGPPIISLSGNESYLNISISLPGETTATKQIRQFYRSVSFNISWKKAGQSEAEHISTSRTSPRQHVLENLQPGQQYCVRVLPKIISNLNTRASAWQCEYPSKVEPRGGLYLMSWTLGVSVPSVAVLLLVLSLVYAGFLCKLKTPLPKSLSNMVQAHYLIPEETTCERVLSTEAQLNSASKNYPSKANNPLNVEEDSGISRHEENYANQADTDDEEDYEEEHKGTYTGCVIDDSGSDTHKSKEKAVVSTLHERSQHFSGQAREEVHHDEPECVHALRSVFEDSRHRQTHSEAKGNEDASGNINLFSVTLRALEPPDDEVCEPLLLESVLGLPTSDHSVLEEHTEEEEEEELLLEATLTDMRAGVEEDSPSGYMATHTGNMNELQRSSSEETDCDTDYLTR
ncbi:unnamed protein product [Leuciscus chuanchicus]